MFSKRKDDYDLRIIDFGLAQYLEGAESIKVGMCGTIEYMSPEVMNADFASSASDLWGVGVITYQLLSGGISPFFAINRFRTMAKVLNLDYSLDQAELCKVSDEAKDFISRLLLKDPKKRLTASQCLEHGWLKDEKLYLGILQTLETIWMRRCLARRRWYRLFNALRVMRRVRNLLSEIQLNSSSDDEQVQNENHPDGQQEVILKNHPVYFHPFTRYSTLFDKIHLVANNGTFGTVFSVMHKETGECFAARHVRDLERRTELRDEAAILWQIRNVPELVQLQGLYEGPSQSVLIIDDLIGGDLAERVSKPGFELNEGKCRNYVQQICRGLAYVHKQDIVHLDLKPFNLVFATVEEDSLLKITDFTFAKRLNKAYESNPNLATKSTKISKLNGTVEFLAPEIIECSYATFATDCWSLGIIAYMLVTGGKSPFYGGNRFRTIAKVLSCQYDLHGPEFNYISREAKDFIQQLLQTQQTHRMSVNQCLKHDWLEGESIPGETMHTLEVIPSLEVKNF